MPAALFENSSRQNLRKGFSVCAVIMIATALMNPSQAEPARPDRAQIKLEERALRVFAARTYLTELRRAENVAYALFKVATPYCVSHRKYSMGVPPLSAKDLPPEVRLGYAELIDTDRPDALRFMHVHGLSPTFRAGVQEGDVLLSMTDQATGKELTPGWVVDRPANTLASNERIAFKVARNKTTLELTDFPQLICDIKLTLVRTDALLARIDSGVLTLSTGLLRFVPNDHELALVLANELMHYQFYLARASKYRAIATPVGTDVTYTPEEEYQADYLSLYLVAAASFNHARSPDVWKRFATAPQNQTKGSVGFRHPLTATRSFYLNSILEEIQRKTRAGQRIVPTAQPALPVSEAYFEKDITQVVAAQNLPSASAVTANPQLHSVTNIPFIDNEGVSGYQRFLNTPMRPRAFAIGPNKNRGGGSWAFRTGANATADALAQCALFARGPCYLYAIDDQLVWNAETAQDLPDGKQASVTSMIAAEAPTATDYAAIGDIAAIPLRQAEISRYRAFLEKPSPRAFVITQSGSGRYWLGPAALHDALAYCERSEEACWLYAVNDAVVWSKETANRISSRDQLKAYKEESGFLEK